MSTPRSTVLGPTSSSPLTWTPCRRSSPAAKMSEFIYGRGSCDAKGIIAAQIAAAERLREQGAKIGLLFVVGEERDSAGARLANDNPSGSRFLINGEPTDNRLALASKGALRATFRATGKMAHSAYPELGDSAIHKLIHALEKVLALKLPVRRRRRPRHPEHRHHPRRPRAQRHRR